jgi:FMN phosphatase YigB (HAD superfamily)
MTIESPGERSSRILRIANPHAVATKKNRYSLGGAPKPDGRTAWALKVKRLTTEYTKRLGNPTDPLTVFAIRSVAEDIADFDEMRATARARGNNSAKVINAHNAKKSEIRRQLRALGLGDIPNIYAPPKPKPKSHGRQAMLDKAERALEGAR